LARHVVKNASSLHGYLAKVVMEANKVEQKHMAPKLFYVFRPQDSIDSLVSNQKKHLYSKAIDANSIGMTNLEGGMGQRSLSRGCLLHNF
jgi:hypothetical protein